MSGASPEPTDPYAPPRSGFEQPEPAAEVSEFGLFGWRKTTWWRIHAVVLCVSALLRLLKLLAE